MTGWEGVTGSELVLYTLDSGAEERVLHRDGIIEAPNWTPDGRALIVNGGGQLYRVPLEAPCLERIDTGFATCLNNDHGISPDGQMLAISDKVETGESCIYRLPISGGTPERITPRCRLTGMAGRLMGRRLPIARAGTGPM